MADNGNVERQGAGATIGWLAQAEVNSLNTAMWRGVDDAARAHGANLLFVPGDIIDSPIGYLAQSNVLYDLLGAENVDGLLVWGGLLSQYISLDEFKAFCERYEPLPLVNLGMPLEGVASVWVDSYSGMRDAVRHLVGVHGFRRIAFLRGASGPESADRYRAYTDVLAENDIALDLDLVTPSSDQQRADGSQAVRLLLDERQVEFEAVVASTDAMALGALAELQRRGFRVPGDVAVVGFDDVEEAETAAPPLTTVRQPMRALAQRGAELLFGLLEGEEVPSQLTLPTELVVRQSCGCLDAKVVQVADVGMPSSSLDPSIDDTDTPRPALEDRVASQRRDILAAIEQAASADSGALGLGWSQRLLDAFILDMKGQAPGIFVSDLSQALQDVAGAGGDVAAWQGVISNLRRHILPLLDGTPGVQTRCETIVQQARVAIASAAERTRAAQIHAIQRRAIRLQEARQVLLAATNTEELLDAVVQELPRLGIPSCYLSLYEYPESPGAGARLVLALHEGVRIDLEGGEIPFASRDLVPAGLLPRDGQSSMSLEPLYFKEGQFGFALLAVGPDQADIREQLRIDLSGALQQGLLVTELEIRAQQLQTLYETSGALSAHMEEEPLIRAILEAITQALGCESVGVSIVDEDTRTISLKHLLSGGEFNIFPEWMEASSYPLDHADITADIYRSGRTEIIGEWDERFNREIWDSYNHEQLLRIFAPIGVRGRTLGVIEVAYDKSQKAAVTQQEADLLSAFIDQAAVALQQVRQFESTQRALEELEATQRRYMRQAWSDYSTSLESLRGYVRAGDEQGPSTEDWLPQMSTALQEMDLVVHEDDQDGSVLAVPLIVQGQVIGVLGGHRPDGGDWSEDQIAATQAIVEQMALALENQRLFDEETRSRRLLDQRVKELDCLSDIGRQIDELPEVPEFLEWVTKRVPAAMQFPGLCLVAIVYQGQVYGEAEANDLSCQIVQGLQSGGQKVGRVCIAYREERDFLDEESALLGDISRRVGGYIENRTLLQQERTRAEEQATLRSITEAVSRSLEMQELVDTAVETLRPALRFDSLLVSLVDEETGDLYMASQEGLPEAMARSLEQNGLEGTLCDYVFQTGETIGISDVRLGAPVEVEGVIKQGLLSYVGIPFSYLDERFGTICGFNREVREFSPEQLTLLESIGDQIGVGVANARLFAETQAALAEVEATHRSYLRQAWGDHLRQRSTLQKSGFLFDEAQAEKPGDIQVVPDLWLPEMEAALAGGAIATSVAGAVDGERAGLALPITIRGETIGVLGIEMPEGEHEWTEEERTFVQAVGEQLGQALEGARLFADTQRRAERERLIGEITAKIRASTDVRDVLQTTAEELGQALGISRASVRIGRVELENGVSAADREKESIPPASEPAGDDS